MTRSDPMNRRQFLRQAALLGGTAFLTACGPKTPGPTPAATTTATTAPTAMPSPLTLPAATATRSQPPTSYPTVEAVTVVPPTAEVTATPAAASTGWVGAVALVKTADRAAGVRGAIELLDSNEVKGKAVLLKPNFNSADPAPGSTHPDVLRAVVEQLQGMGAGKITVGDRSGMGNTRRVMQQLGVFDLAGKLNFDTLVFDELDERQWTLIQSKDLHWERGYAVPRILLDSEAVVQTCNLKTHRFGGHFTLSLKNSVGFAAKQVGGAGYNYMSELHGSPHQRTMIAEINRSYAPALVVMDGVEAFANGGPDRGAVIRPEVVLASRDRIALDAVGVAILRLFGTTPQVSEGRIFEQAQIARAVELELGARRPEDVRIVTRDAASEAFAAQLRPLMS
jgi:uncharacterized protein (DUF362 family)